MKLKCGKFTIEGYSRSAIETYFKIPELKLSFDIGKAPLHIVPISNIFISHLHGDHAIGIPYYVAQRTLGRLPPGNIYLPSEAIEGMDVILQQFARLEKSRRNYNLIPVKHGDEILYNKDYIIKVFETDHRIPSVGYQVIEIKKKLKPEYLGKSSLEIISLKKQGINIINELKIPVITYIGDSSVSILDKYEFIKDSEILILECTFLSPDHIDQAIKRRHIHLHDIKNKLEEFNNRYIILSHFSMRYTEETIRKYVYDSLSDKLKEKIFLFI